MMKENECFEDDDDDEFDDDDDDEEMKLIQHGQTASRITNNNVSLL